MDKSSFQFLGFKILKTNIDIKEGETPTEINVGFSPEGTIIKNESKFELVLKTVIKDGNDILNIEVHSKAYFLFDENQDNATLDNLFYLNAPALLFPYIRAYISTLTNLSGFAPITLPTFNLSELGKELKSNTSEK
jgi:preprotein translocase subunit SecB